MTAYDVVNLQAYRYLRAAHDHWCDFSDANAALILVEQALYIDPNFIEASLLKADLLHELEEVEDALDALDTLLKNHPDCLEGYLAKIALLMYEGRRQAASVICGEAFRNIQEYRQSSAWALPYLFRHKLALQMDLNRGWATEETMRLASQYLSPADANLLQSFLNELSRQYRFKRKRSLHLKVIVSSNR